MGDKMRVACPRCGVFNLTQRKAGFFGIGAGWSDLTCQACKLKYEYNETAAQIMSCDNCHEVVAFTKEKVDICPACGRHLSAPPMRAIGCPACSGRVLFVAGQTSVTCPNMNCRTTFNPEEVRAHVENTNANAAPDIRMTGKLTDEQLVWRHPKLDQMPLDAQIKPYPGMQAVGLNGTTQRFLVNERAVLLSDTDLRNEASTYDGATVCMTDIDIFYVKYHLDTVIPWGARVCLADPYGVRTAFQMYGDLRLETIEDPAAFLRSFGYDPEKLLRSKFSNKEDENGYMPEYTRKLQERINDVLQRVLESARDVNAVATDDLENNPGLIREELTRYANMEMAAYGLKASVSTCVVRKVETTIAQDVLERRISGPMSWKLDRAVRVHEPGDRTSWIELVTGGRFYVDILDRNRFNSCLEAYAWRDPQKSDSIARQEFVDMVADQLYSFVKSQLQMITDETGCSLEDLDTFEANLRRKGDALLNDMDGFFGSRGLVVRDMSVKVSVEKKSDVYAGKENLAVKGNLVGLKRKNDELDTEMFIGETIEADKRKDVLQKAARNDLQRDLEMDEMQVKADMRRAELEAMKARQQREISFENWADRQRQLQAQDEADYARNRRAREEQYKTNVSDAEHQARLKEIARRIDESDLAWNEKLEAYARLQRGISFQDKLGEREALAEAEAREKRLERVLRTEDMQALQEIRREEELHQENLEKQRFAREMELRRQKMAEDTARLQAQFERERAIAQEHENRMKSREEVETLRLMLEYLAKSGDQQVTAEALREARQEAQLQWERDHAEAERKAAREEEARQQKAEGEMIAQAMALLSQANAAKDTAAGQQDDEARKAAVNIQKIIDELSGIRSALESGNERETAAEVVNGMDTWFDGFLSRIGQRTAPFQPVTASASVGVRCRACGRVFDEKAFRCPHCGNIG